MKGFLAPHIGSITTFVAFIIALVTPFATQAKILIGMPGPMTGGMAWFGEQMQQGMAMKIAELNAAGGVLGQQVELLMVDDYCNPEQAIAAANKLVEARVGAVIVTFAPARRSPPRRSMKREASFSFRRALRTLS
jgi:hypothetical protein